MKILNLGLHNYLVRKIMPVSKPKAAFCVNCPARRNCRAIYDTKACRETKRKLAEKMVAENNQEAAKYRRLRLI